MRTCIHTMVPVSSASRPRAIRHRNTFVYFVVFNFGTFFSIHDKHTILNCSRWVGGRGWVHFKYNIHSCQHFCRCTTGRCEWRRDIVWFPFSRANLLRYLSLHYLKFCPHSIALAAACARRKQTLVGTREQPNSHTRVFSTKPAATEQTERKQTLPIPM